MRYIMFAFWSSCCGFGAYLGNLPLQQIVELMLAMFAGCIFTNIYYGNSEQKDVHK